MLQKLRTTYQKLLQAARLYERHFLSEAFMSNPKIVFFTLFLWTRLEIYIKKYLIIEKRQNYSKADISFNIDPKHSNLEKLKNKIFSL